MVVGFQLVRDHLVTIHRQLVRDHLVTIHRQLVRDHLVTIHRQLLKDHFDGSFLEGAGVNKSWTTSLAQG